MSRWHDAHATTGTPMGVWQGGIATKYATFLPLDPTVGGPYWEHLNGTNVSDVSIHNQSTIHHSTLHESISREALTGRPDTRDQHASQSTATILKYKT